MLINGKLVELQTGWKCVLRRDDNVAFVDANWKVLLPDGGAEIELKELGNKWDK